MYCDPGQEATVIFSDGNKVISQDTPITITCSNDCSHAAITFRYVLRKSFGALETHELTMDNLYGPVTDIRIDRWPDGEPYPYIIQAYCRGSRSVGVCQQPQWVAVASTPPSRRDEYVSVELLTVTYKSRVIITGNSGNILFDEIKACEFEVNCGGCPPNHIECEDGCCLDCETVMIILCKVKYILGI